MSIPKIKSVLGSGFYWQTIVEDVNSEIWEGWFDSYTKRTVWLKVERKS